MTKKPSHQIEIHHFVSTEPGPHLLVTGAVHGDEPCGTMALRKIIERFNAGRLRLACGSVTFIPICNPPAFARKQRYIEQNLNRVMRPCAKPCSIEEHLAVVLMREIARCDWLLDLHSTSAESRPFVFQDYADSKTRRFAQALGLDHVITGWPEMFATPEAQGLNEGDTVSFAHSLGKTGVVVECGSHKNPRASRLAEAVVMRALVFLGLCAGKENKAKADKKPALVKAMCVKTKKHDGALARAWHHLDKIKKGDVLALYTNGTHEVAPYDGFILLPKAKASQGQEWFYLGKALSRR